MKGVCTICQSVHTVRRLAGSFDMDDDRDFIPRLPDKEYPEDYVMGFHNCAGTACEGEGTTPQALIRERQTA